MSVTWQSRVITNLYELWWPHSFRTRYIHVVHSLRYFYGAMPCIRFTVLRGFWCLATCDGSNLLCDDGSSRPNSDRHQFWQPGDPFRIVAIRRNYWGVSLMTKSLKGTRIHSRSTLSRNDFRLTSRLFERRVVRIVTMLATRRSVSGRHHRCRPDTVRVYWTWMT